MQLSQTSRRAAVVCAVVFGMMGHFGSLASADGLLAMRGYYYKEDATRVMQPMLDAEFDVGEAGRLNAHTLVDAITSASAASGASGEAFTERRYEGGVGYQHTLGITRLRGSARISSEPDYKSVFAGAGGDVEVAERNTTIGIFAGFGSDNLTNAGAQDGMGVPIDESLSTLLASISLAQVLSPVAVAGLTYDISHLDGFLENPYRSVIAGGARIAERVPDDRLRHAMNASLRVHWPAMTTTIIGGYRFYFDDWGITAHTPEVRTVTSFGDDVSAHFRLRYHRQGKADFFKPVYDSSDPAVEPYLTDDPKLSAFDSQLIGGKLSIAANALGVRGSLAPIRGELAAEFLRQDNRYGNAVVLYAALVVPFEY